MVRRDVNALKQNYKEALVALYRERLFFMGFLHKTTTSERRRTLIKEMVQFASARISHTLHTRPGEIFSAV